MKENKDMLRDWDSLNEAEQTAVRIEYGHYLDTLPPTCSLETKLDRFRSWLREHKGTKFPEQSGPFTVITIDCVVHHRGRV